jgi:PAS domain S-box-containing protein
MNQIKQDTILIVDDTPAVIEVLQKILINHGYEVHIATTGKKALSRLQSAIPDLILMDILMPDLDGYETCKLIKNNELTKDVPIIFLSALAESFDKVKAFQSGGVDYITKPIEAEELLARIETHLKINYLQKKLKDINESLEEKVKIRTAELDKTNSKLKEEIQQRIATEDELINSYDSLQKINHELIKSEEKFRNIFNSTNDALTLINFSNHTFIDVNEAFIKLTGYTKDEILVKKTYDFFAIHSNEKKNEMHQNYDEIEKTSHYEIELIPKTGKLIPVEMNSRIALFDGNQALISVIRDITERKVTERRILTAIIDAEERERSHFSRELHDGLGPMLSTIKLYFQWLADTTEDEKRINITEKGNSNIDEAILTLKEISNNLSPRVLNNNGVVPAIRNFINRLNEIEKLAVNFVYNNNLRFEKNIEITLYRITTELINNTLKYAEATQANIILNYDEKLQNIYYKYTDNGKGFDLNKVLNNRKGLGMTNIIQRVNSLNGKLLMESSEGNGIKIEIELPFQEIK